MKNIVESFEKADTHVIILVNIPLLLICGLIDFLTGVEFDFSIFYLIPIAATSWYAGKRYGVFLSVISEIIWFFADLLGGHIYSTIIILLWNSLMRFTLFVIIALLIARFKSKMQKIYQSELLLEKNKTVINTLQQLTALIADNIISQNAEIIKWINKKRSRGESVSEKVDRASQIIGLSMKLLSETSFIHPYKQNIPNDPDAYLELMKKKLSQINQNISHHDAKSI